MTNRLLVDLYLSVLLISLDRFNWEICTVNELLKYIVKGSYFA